MARGSRKGIGAAGAAARTSRSQQTRRRPSSRKPSRSLQPQQPPRKQPRRSQKPGSTTRTRAARRRSSSRRVRLPPAAARQQHLRVSQGKRKGKQRGPREFVGPMDHSYRAVNGNVADGPPSTIQITSNGHGGATITTTIRGRRRLPVREDAPTRIFCFIEDLFFLAKIQETSRKLGVKVEFVKGDKESVARISTRRKPNGPRCWSST